MILNNEQTIFEIPSLQSEWIFNAQLFFNEDYNIYYICDELEEVIGTHLCKFTILHSIVGDIHKFQIICIGFNTDDTFFKSVFEPILSDYCNEKIIELNYDNLI